MVVALLDPQIDAVIIALVGAIIFWAFGNLIRPLFSGIAANVPVVGQQLADAADAIVQSAVSTATSWIDTAATPLALAMVAPVLGAYQLVELLILVLTAIVEWITGGSTTSTTTAVAGAVAPLQSEVATLEGELQTLTDLAIPALSSQIQSVADTTISRFQQDETAAAQAIDGVTSQLEGQIAAAVQSVEGEIAQAQAQAVAAAQSIEAGIIDQVTQTAQFIEGEIVTARQQVEGELGVAIDGVESQLQGILGQVGAAAAAAAFAGTTALAVETALTDYLNECGDPICNTFKPEIPNVTGAFNLITDAALAAFLAYCIADPDGAAAFTDTLVTGPAAGAANTLASVVGGL